MNIFSTHADIIKQSACVLCSGLLHWVQANCYIDSGMARLDSQTNIRIPIDLKHWLRLEAEKAKRSVTAEIVMRLEQSRAQQRAAKEDQQ